MPLKYMGKVAFWDVQQSEAVENELALQTDFIQIWLNEIQPSSQFCAGAKIFNDIKKGKYSENNVYCTFLR